MFGGGVYVWRGVCMFGIAIVPIATYSYIHINLVYSIRNPESNQINNLVDIRYIQYIYDPVYISWSGIFVISYSPSLCSTSCLLSKHVYTEPQT